MNTKTSVIIELSGEDLYQAGELMKQHGLETVQDLLLHLLRREGRSGKSKFPDVLGIKPEAAPCIARREGKKHDISP